jgi:hypothetical protein
LLGQSDEFCDRVRGECSGQAAGLREEIGHSAWDTENHPLLIRDEQEQMICLRLLGIGGAQRETMSKEGVGGIGDFDLDPFLLCEESWVIERGIKVIDPSTILTITS